MHNQRLAIFSDLDGCLLNKSDYSFQAAVPTLRRIHELKIPLVLASSKTEAEMKPLAEEMELDDAPLICENGGVICWSRQADRDENKLVLGTERAFILQVLLGLKPDFSFTSFDDMRVEGIMAATDLSRSRAEAALQRSCTEPLLWTDRAERLADFEAALRAASLSLTRGGRFWHVAGRMDKGEAMRKVLASWSPADGTTRICIAIGDSPIDQSMLDLADYAIAIPDPNGLVHVRVAGQNSRVAGQAGAAGWAESVSSVLDALT